MNRRQLEPQEREAPSDDEVVRRVRAGEIDLFEILMRRYNRRVYRLCRAVLRGAGEAEDAAQEAWVRAYTHLAQFESRAAFSTWLSRIALHEAWARARRVRRTEAIEPDLSEEGREMKLVSGGLDPERELLGGEVRALVEAAVEALPETYRTVFMLREVEDLSTAETAECLDVSEETVKTRLHRARAALRIALLASAGAEIRYSFDFLGTRCDRLVERVLARIRTGEVTGLSDSP